MSKESFYTYLQQEPVSAEDSIHPDFPLRIARFVQNRPWDREQTGGLPPEIKVAFTFDDPVLLDDCPFVTKVSGDERGECKYFGVAYGLGQEGQDLREWAQRFPSAKLFTYEGEFVEVITGNDTTSDLS